MPARTPSRPRVDVTYADACALLESTLDSSLRRDILDAARSTRGFKTAAGRLKAAMRGHSFPTSAAPVVLDRVVRQLDSATRAEGFHVLQSWDYRAHRFVDDSSAVLLLDRIASGGTPTGDEHERAILSTLLDQYLLSILGLLAVRAWDEGDANANFDRVTRLLGLLGGPDGSGHRFIERSELLLLLAVAQYHPKEPAYDLLLSRVKDLDDSHRGNVALATAASLGSHLRWGFRFMYQRDEARMRDDNVVDYPWLLFSIATLLEAYCRTQAGAEYAIDLDAVAGGLINGLTADPSAFTGDAPESLHLDQASHAEVRERLASHRLDLRGAFERHRPDGKTYSPLAFECNFLNNAFVAMVVTGAGADTTHPSLDALLTERADPGATSAIRYARMLTRYAGVTAERAGGHSLIVYDPHDGSSSFDAALRTLSE